MDASNAEARRKISLPPALQKDQSFEENWVKISLEPNPVKPVQDESTSVVPELKEVNTHDESAETPIKRDVSDQKKADRNFGIKTESSSLGFADQTTFQIVSEKTPPSKPARINQDVSSERRSFSPVDKPNISRRPDQEVTESDDALKGGNQRNSIKILLTDSETDKPALTNSANEREVKAVSRDEEASLDRKGSERKNVSSGMLAKTDTDLVLERVAGEEQIDEQSPVEHPSQSHLITSHEILSDPQQENIHHFRHDHPVEIVKKSSNTQIDLSLPNRKTTDTSVTEPRANDITVKRDSEDKEKIKASNDVNLPKDQRSPSRVLSELSKERLSMTDDVKLAHGGDPKHGEKTHHEEKEKIKTKPSNDLNRPLHTRTSPSDVLTELSKDHLAMTDDGKLVHSGDVTLQETAFNTTPPDKDAAVIEQAQGSSEMKAVEGDTDQKAEESNILLSVLARAQRAKPPVLRDDKIPTIVIMPSESPDPKLKEGNYSFSFF